jgi:ribosomal protein L20A (L18A)
MRYFRVWPAADERLKRRSVRVLEVARIDAERVGGFCVRSLLRVT